MSANAKSLNQLGATVDTSVIAEVSTLVSQITGVQLGERQKVMVETRLMRRIAHLGLKNGWEYSEYLRQHQAEETKALISLLTTHHSFFFREFQHFQFLEATALTVATQTARRRGEKRIRIWSAACSRGQEAYSLAMFAAYHLAKIDPEMQYEILGTDVDRESVAVATNGVFNVREIKQIPAVYLANHWANGTGDIADFVKAKKSIREKCRFRVANLLDLGELSTYGKFDLIFCRNVFIYFTPEQTKIIAHNLLKTLHESGYLLVGISESLSKMGLPIIPVGPSVYAHKKAVVVTSADKEAYVKKLETSPLVQMPKSAVLIPAKMRVLCVDDSPSVLAVMKQVLRDNHGFEVVGTAINGVEAQRQVKALKPDLVTLDIHMPEMTGLEYLKKHWDKNHPPVVIVSSVAREDASLALECLTAGASDYVEKPSLNNLAERGEEIRIKLACALKRKDQVPIKDELLNHKTLPPLRVQSVRVLIGGMGDQKALTDVMRDLATFKAPIVILTQGVGQAVTAMGQNLEHSSGLKIKPCSQEKLDAHGVFIGELQQHWHLVLENRSAENVSVMVFGSLSSTAQKQLASARGAQILVEDLAGNTPVNMPGWVSDICPTTSFAYRANSFLGIKK